MSGEFKTKYRHIRFEPAANDWACMNSKSGDVLGSVSYYKRWKKWVIEFQEDCVFDSKCLRDIADFLDQLNKV